MGRSDKWVVIASVLVVALVAWAISAPTAGAGNLEGLIIELDQKTEILKGQVVQLQNEVSTLGRLAKTEHTLSKPAPRAK